jgi:ABC-type Zn uptake system ZnuABC Zn-binding protein ZnuA/ABC-type Mn2+/Zn2+ transport system permease subunit
MLDPFSLPFFQRAVLEVLALALGAGLLGTWIVLRGQAFYAHAVGTATFPGLVLADGLGFSAALGAFGTAVLVALAVAALGRRRGGAADSQTALVLCAALAVGVILASDVFASRANVDTLLFGSLLAVDRGDVLLAAGVAVAVLAASAVLGPRWLATGFDPDTARAQGLRSPVPDTLLLVLIALAAVSVLSAVGALLATAILVVPAATARLLTQRLRAWQVATVALAAAEGVAGLWLSFQTDAPPGATIAVLAGALFALAALWRALGAQRRAAVPAAATACVAAFALAGCGGTDSGARGGHGVRVVVTTTQLGDVAREVGGDAASVTQLLQPNTDPHEYEPRPSDVKALAGADVVLASGVGLDHWLAKVAGEAGVGDKVVDVGDRVPYRVSTAQGRDPHWWGDPRNVEAAAGIAAGAMAKAAPDVRARVQAGARRYRAHLQRLDAALGRCLATVPRNERRIVTDHDAFATFAHRYAVEIVGAVIPSLTTRAQPSARDLAGLSDVIRRERVRVVYPETSLNPKLARAVAAQTGARVGETLYADTLGPQGSPGATYAGALAHNVTALMHGFTDGKRGCAAPGA